MPAPNPYEYADRLEPELRKLYLRLVNEAKGRIPLEQLAQALEAGNYDSVIRLIDQAATSVAPATAAAWRRAIAEIVLKTAAASAVKVGGLFGFTFNIFNPNVLAMIDAMTGDRVLVDDATKAAIKYIMRAGKLEGISPPDEAKMIRALIGPTPQHQDAAYRHLQSMLESGVPTKRALQNFYMYSNRLTNWRADVIVRTEGIQAANAGRLSMWDQLIDDGVIERDRAKLMWRVTDDDRLCPYCAPMDGQQIWFPQDITDIKEWEMFASNKKGYPGEPERRSRRYDSLKPDPYGPLRDEKGRFTIAKAMTDRPVTVYVPYPPLHPMCRCDVRLIML